MKKHSRRFQAIGGCVFVILYYYPYKIKATMGNFFVLLFFIQKLGKHNIVTKKYY